MCISVLLNLENVSFFYKSYKVKIGGKLSLWYKLVYIDNLKVVFCLFLEYFVILSLFLEKYGFWIIIIVLDVIWDGCIESNLLISMNYVYRRLDI